MFEILTFDNNYNGMFLYLYGLYGLYDLSSSQDTSSCHGENRRYIPNRLTVDKSLCKLNKIKLSNNMCDNLKMIKLGTTIPD